MSADDVEDRLEMLLVARWLEEGAGDDGDVAVAIEDLADELGLETGRSGLLVVMAALGELEHRRKVRVSWPLGGASGGEARIHLADELRGDARRLFGR